MKLIKTKTNRNILLVANYKSDVGYAWWLMENFWIQISHFFKNQNRNCFLLYPVINSVPESIINAPIELIEYDFSNRSRESKRKLKNIIRNNSIYSVYLTDKKYYDYYYFFLRKWGVKNIVLHDHTPGERAPIPFYKKSLKKIIHAVGMFSCDYYIGVSKFVYDRFQDIGCIPSRKCSYVNNGIRPIRIDLNNRDYCHNQFGIPKGSIIVVTTGRATYYKGIDFIIRCADILINRNKVDNLYFIHCGDGPDLGSFKELVNHYKLSGKFIFSGKRSDISNILQSCNIGIQASAGEAFSLSILEYLNAGLATVVPNNCGNSEAVEDGINGMLYEPNNIMELSNTLFELIHNKELREKIGREGMITVLNKFNIKKTNNDLLKILANKL